MSDSLYETKLGSVNSSVEVLGSKSLKFETNKWQKHNESGFDEIPERHGDYDDMDQESRESLSDNVKQYRSLDPKESPIRESMVRGNQSTHSISPDPLRKVKLLSENDANSTEFSPGKTTLKGQTHYLQNKLIQAMDQIQVQDLGEQKIIEYNRTLQSALLEMKRENDELAESLTILLQGGDKSLVLQRLQNRHSAPTGYVEEVTSKGARNPFQTPAPIQYYDDMEEDSGYVKYNEDQDEEEILRIRHQRSRSAATAPNQEERVVSVSAKPSLEESQILVESASVKRETEPLINTNLKYQQAVQSSQFLKQQSLEEPMTSGFKEYAPPKTRATIGYLIKEDKVQLKQMKQELISFKKNLPDPYEVKELVASTKEIHSKIVDHRTSYTRDITYKADSVTEELSEIQDENIPSPERRYHNKFIKNLVKNVDMAFNYRPGEEDRPMFRFQGASGGIVKLDSNSRNQFGRANSIQTEQPERGRLTIGGSALGHNTSVMNVVDDQSSMMAYHRGTSVPAKYVQPMGRNAEKDFDPDFGKPWVPKRKRGPIQKFYDYDIQLLGEKHVDKFRVNVKKNIETKATTSFLKKLEMEYGAGTKQADKAKTLDDIVRSYSTFTFEKSEEIKFHVKEMKAASYEASKWAICGPGAPNFPKSHMRHPMVEKYGGFAINLGINNELDTELNMSPEGKLRRQALTDKDEAAKKLEDFVKSPKKKKKDGELNLTLKKMD